MALKNLMNNYFYGKQGQGDYTVANMPQNRRQLFGEVFKVRWSGLFGVNLLYMIIWIPAIAWTMLNVAAILNLAQNGDTTELPSLINTWLLILVPCVAITGPFDAGVTYVLRNWARDEHSFVLSDFKDALKANWKQALGVSVIGGLLPFLLYVCWTFYNSMLASSMVFIVPVALVLLVGVLWNLASMLMMPMLITYDLKLKDVLRNSFLLTVAKLPWAVLIRLLTLALPLLGLAVSMLVPQTQNYVPVAVGAVYLVFMVAFNKLITVSYANWLCETYLNARIEGARTNIGLRPENWDDTEYIPEDDEN